MNVVTFCPAASNDDSLVLRVAYGHTSVLLEGDAQVASERRMLAQDLHADLLKVGHHGSKTSNKAELASWARPKLAISSQGPPRGQFVDPYGAVAARYLRTWKEGAVTLRRAEGRWLAETYSTKINYFFLDN